jgi:hypothetical protein
VHREMFRSLWNYPLLVSSLPSRACFVEASFRDKKSVTSRNTSYSRDISRLRGVIKPYTIPFLPLRGIMWYARKITCRPIIAVSPGHNVTSAHKERPIDFSTRRSRRRKTYTSTAASTREYSI